MIKFECPCFDVAVILGISGGVPSGTGINVKGVENSWNFFSNSKRNTRILFIVGKTRFIEFEIVFIALLFQTNGLFLFKLIQYSLYR
jgi:hypothetical protein